MEPAPTKLSAEVVGDTIPPSFDGQTTCSFDRGRRRMVCGHPAARAHICGFDPAVFCAHLPPDAGAILLAARGTAGRVCSLQRLLLRLLGGFAQWLDLQNPIKPAFHPGRLVHGLVGHPERIPATVS